MNDIVRKCPLTVGDKLYRLHQKDPPLHIVAVLTKEASSPWPWLLVTKRWRPAKQRWEHEIVNPYEVQGGSKFSESWGLYGTKRETVVSFLFFKVVNVVVFIMGVFVAFFVGRYMPAPEGSALERLDEAVDDHFDDDDGCT